MNRNKAQRQILLDQLSQLACDEDAQPIDTILKTRDQHQKNYESQYGCCCLAGFRIVQPGVDELAIISARKNPLVILIPITAHLLLTNQDRHKYSRESRMPDKSMQTRRGKPHATDAPAEPPTCDPP